MSSSIDLQGPSIHKHNQRMALGYGLWAHLGEEGSLLAWGGVIGGDADEDGGRGGDTRGMTEDLL